MSAGTASIFIVADTNIYLHSLPLLERFMYHLGPSCGAVADLGSVGLQCAVIIPQVSSISMNDGELNDDVTISGRLVCTHAAGSMLPPAPKRGFMPVSPQVVWRELDGLKGCEDRRAAVHNAIRLVNADEHSERPFFIHQTLQLLEQVGASVVATSSLSKVGYAWQLPPDKLVGVLDRLRRYMWRPSA